MKTRFVITKLDNSGLRTLACANQGRNHYDTQQEAERSLVAILNPSVNSADTLKSVFGDVSQMKVLAVPCYDHGDAMHTVFSDDKSLI